MPALTEAERAERTKKIADRKPSPEEVAIEKSPVKTYAFRNLESPGKDGNPGACLRSNYGPKFKVEIDDGQIVDLPECVADWLNSLETPRYTIEPILDPLTKRPTGESRHVKLPVGNARFSLTEYKPPKPLGLPDGQAAEDTQSLEEPNDE